MSDDRVSDSLNIVFIGGFPYPQGMAGTKRIQHAIDGMKRLGNVKSGVIVLRQSSTANIPTGVYQGTPYETVMPDLMRIKLVLLAPLFYAKARHAIRSAFDSNRKNILFVYGPPEIDNVPLVGFARRLGYKIVFDIVEDDDAAAEISVSLYHRLKNFYTRRRTARIASLADGIVVISSHLERKFSLLSQDSIPIHLRPISVDFSRFEASLDENCQSRRLFYAGSFGVKDGVHNLLDAFDVLAQRYSFLRLVMTGKGSHEDLQPVLNRIARSPFGERIEYRGFLDDDTYYKLLQLPGLIPCMTRIDLPYAHGGFPFKLGEFLATGKPVIASRVSDVGRFLTDKEDALLVSPGSVGDIVDAVEFIQNNPEAALKIGKLGKCRAFTCFDLHSQAHFLRNYLLEV